MQKFLGNLQLKCLELVNEFNRVTEYKIDVPKSVIVLSTSDEHMEARNTITILYVITQN